MLAQKGLDKMAPSDEAEKATLKKVSKRLDEGASALKMHQKHIKVANHSEYGWSTVRHYQSDPLTSDSEDKRKPYRAEKDAKKDFEQLEMTKWQQGGGTWSTRRKCPPAYHPYRKYHQDPSWDGPGPSSTKSTSATDVRVAPDTSQTQSTGPLFLLWGIWPPGGNMPCQRTKSILQFLARGVACPSILDCIENGYRLPL